MDGGNILLEALFIIGVVFGGILVICMASGG